MQLLESLNEEFRRKFLEKITLYFNSHSSFSTGYNESKNLKSTYSQSQYKFPSTCPDDCTFPTDMDRIENVVDATDGFLMAAFKRYLVVPSKTRKLAKTTLYETYVIIHYSLFSALSLVYSNYNHYKIAIFLKKL